MDDYLSIYQKCDAERLSNLEQLVNQSIHNREIPEKLSFPITVQFELMAECNLQCLHCYNRSGDSDLDTSMGLEEWLKLSHHLVFSNVSCRVVNFC